MYKNPGGHSPLRLPTPMPLGGTIGTCAHYLSISVKRQRIKLFGLRVKLPLVTYQSNHVEAIPLNALSNDTTSELVGLSSH